MNFQKGVIILFVVILLIILIFLGVTMTNNKATTIPWPPVISNCPDYWTDTPEESPPETIYVQTCTDQGTCWQYSDSTKCNSGEKQCFLEDGITKCIEGDTNCSCENCTSVLCTTCSGEWISNPDYATYKNKIPTPYVPGSRCIGTKGKNTGTLPDDPTVSCTKDNDGKYTICNGPPQTIANFSTDYYTGSQANCNKQTWANGAGGISWDGITYGYGEKDPCS